MNIVETHKTSIASLCQQYGVARLFVFGSVLTPRFNDHSDVDFIVDFQPDIDLFDYAGNYFGFKTSLEKTLGRKVDLLENQAVSNPFLRQSIDRSKQLVYG